MDNIPTSTTTITSPDGTTTTVNLPDTASTVVVAPPALPEKKPLLTSPDLSDPEVRKRNTLWYYITLGIRGLVGSKKGTLALLVLILTTVALFFGKVSGSEYVASLSIIAGVYAATATASDITNMRNQ